MTEPQFGPDQHLYLCVKAAWEYAHEKRAGVEITTSDGHCDQYHPLAWKATFSPHAVLLVKDTSPGNDDPFQPKVNILPLSSIVKVAVP